MSWICDHCGCVSYRHVTDDVFRCNGCNQRVGSLPESDQSLGGSSTGHAHEHEGRSDSESECLFEITDYGMGGKPAWA